MPKNESRVRVYPTETYYLPGVRAVERLVPADIGDALIGSRAFTRQRPEGQDEPSPDVLEDLSDIYRELPHLDPDREEPAPEPAMSVTDAEGGSLNA